MVCDSFDAGNLLQADDIFGSHRPIFHPDNQVCSPAQEFGFAAVPSKQGGCLADRLGFKKLEASQNTSSINV